MRPHLYVLRGHEPVPVDDFMEWGRAFEECDRRVAQDSFGGVDVSTVFVGLDRPFGDGPPRLFETLIWGGPLDGSRWEYSTWAEAETGHARVCRTAQLSLTIRGRAVIALYKLVSRFRFRLWIWRLRRQHRT